MRGYSLNLAGLVVCGLAHQSVAFTTYHHATTMLPSTQLNARGINTCRQEEGTNSGEDWSSEMVPRRAFVKNLASAVAIGAFSSVAAITGSPEEAQAAAASSSYVPGTIWQTGKQPKVPGQKPKDKNDTSGTRKDGNFLRSIADCKSQCENSTGPDGLSRSKEECLSDCQDICCKTYEQCSFAIVPRI